MVRWWQGNGKRCTIQANVFARTQPSNKTNAVHLTDMPGSEEEEEMCESESE